MGFYDDEEEEPTIEDVENELSDAIKKKFNIPKSKDIKLDDLIKINDTYESRKKDRELRQQQQKYRKAQKVTDDVIKKINKLTK